MKRKRALFLLAASIVAAASIGWLAYRHDRPACDPTTALPWLSCE